MNDHSNFIPDAEVLIALALKIIERHSLKGVDSPLKAAQIADLNYRVNFAREKHEQGLKYKKLMEAAWTERDNFIGARDSDVSMLQSLWKITQALQTSYDGNADELSRWGIDTQHQP